MREAVFVDTWGWMALGHRRDARHQEIVEMYQMLKDEEASLHTSDYVMDELITLLFRREVFEESTRFVEGLLQASAEGSLLIERITSKRFADAWRLRQQLADKPWISFTDLTSMVIMQERRINRVLTEDAHFEHVGLGFQREP